MLQNVFSRHPAIGVGFSGIDDNFRFFVSNHRKSRMHELTSDDSPDVRIILIKATQDYHNAITRSGITDAAVITDYARQCRQMSETYYKTYYGIETHWEDTFLDIAGVLRSLC